MNEVKTPKKPLLLYYAIIMIVLIVINSVIIPTIAEMSISEVDYSTFITMTEKKQVGKVQIQDNRILFTDAAGDKIYKTGILNDPNLTERLAASGAKFSGEIKQETSPVLSFLLSWIIPILIFVGLGQFLSK